MRIEKLKNLPKSHSKVEENKSDIKNSTYY